jgi:hypothetical protein
MLKPTPTFHAPHPFQPAPMPAWCDPHAARARRQRDAIVLIGVVLAGVASIFLFWIFLADRTVHITAPQDYAVRLTVDQESPIEIPAGARRDVSVGKGKHVFRFESASNAAPPFTQELTLDAGTFSAVVPSARSQCYVTLDVSMSHYGSRGRKTIRPQLVARHAGAMPFEGSGFYSEESLPQSIKGNGPVHLNVPVSCTDLAKPDTELLDDLL